MRIRNRCLPLPLSSLDHVRNGTAALTNNHFLPSLVRSPETSVIRVSRINGRISSNGDSIGEKKIDSTVAFEHKEPENVVVEEMNFSTQANQSWCDEEKEIPLKKRRISFERNLTLEREKEINESDVSEELRCRRSDGKKWRCGKRRVEGYSMCEHHLEREKISRSRACRRRRDIRRRSRKTKMSKDENGDGKKNITKQVKARSINSLLRNTVPLMLPLK